ncbi:MAG: tetratricopeptide repeat protein [Candidatus Obscuribacterales bacterium]|nr:tetratricopeptide repeat protein [Candidatus Obscuribacterales bacterium]
MALLALVLSPKDLDTINYGRESAEMCENFSGYAFYFALRNYAEALRASERVLQIREKLLGSQRPDVAQALLSLSDVYIAQQNYAAAEPLLERGLRIKKKSGQIFDFARCSVPNSQHFQE